MGTARHMTVVPGRFRRLWASTAAANLGDGILMAGLPVLATTVTTSPLLISAVQVALFGPMLLASLPSGVAADRHDTGRLMTWANLARAGGLVALVALVVMGEWVLAAVYVAAALMGLFETLSDVAAQTALPAIVPAGELGRANARLVGTQVVLNEGVGAPLGSAVATLGAVWLFTATAILYGLAGLWSAALRGLAPATAATGVSRAPIRLAIAEGFGVLWRHQTLRWVALANGLINLGNAAFFGVAVLFYIGPYGLSRSTFGVALTLLAAGGIGGTAIGDRMAELLGHRRTMLLGAMTTGVAYAVMGLWGNRPVAAAALVLLGFTGMVWNVSNRVVRQQLAPPELLGRVVSVMRILALIASPLGAVLGGVVAQTLGLRSVVLITTASAVVAVALLWRIPGSAVAHTTRSSTDPDDVG